MEDMEYSIYNDDNVNNAEEEVAQQQSQVPFLKYLGSMNASCFNHLIDKIFSIVRSDHFKQCLQARELLYKLLGKISIPLNLNTEL